MAKKRNVPRRSKNRNRLIIIVGLLLSLGFGFLISRQNGAGDDSTISIQSVQLSTEELAAGQTVYAENCASCHGANLEGQANWQQQDENGTLKAPPHDENGHTWHHNDEYLLNRIRHGTQGLDPAMQAQSNMPAYDNILTDQEIIVVLGYIKSTWPLNIQEIQAQR